ncbi:hypothetical protein EDD11_004594 [Mortierella claussenii]|nr:hypothetical protein EDD11_004594 [Mortierella claussenii]
MVGGDIAANEDAAIAFCNKANPRAPGAKIFPDGFVLSSHWATGDGWVQITGQIDPSKYNLNPCDAGGQYDIRAPVGATCAGYGYFVNVIEPTDGVYGMKCCQNQGDCNVGQSTYGVRVIFGSQYDFSGPRPDGPLPASVNCVNGQLPGGANTTLVSPTATIAAPLPSPTAINGTTAVISPAASTSAVSSSAASTSAAASATSSGSTAAPKPTIPSGAPISTGKAMMTTIVVLASALGLFFA